MADAGRAATKVKSASRKAAARTKTSGAKASSAMASTSRMPGTKKTSGAKASTSRASKTSRARTSAVRTSGAKTSRTSGARTSGGTTTVQRPAARASAAGGNGVNVPVPILTPHLKVLHVPAPGMTYVEDAGRVVAGYLPPPERLAFYGGLGLAAVLGAIDWPVAAAIGIGAMVARRTGRGMGGMRSRSGRPQGSAKR